MSELEIRCHIVKLQLHGIKSIQSSEFWESGQCIIELLDHVLTATLLVVQKKEKQYNILLNAYVCQSRKCFRYEG